MESFLKNPLELQGAGRDNFGGLPKIEGQVESHLKSIFLVYLSKLEIVGDLECLLMLLDPLARGTDRSDRASCSKPDDAKPGDTDNR